MVMSLPYRTIEEGNMHPEPPADPVSVPGIDDIFGPLPASPPPRRKSDSSPSPAPDIPFTPIHYDTRVCPRCHERKAINRENWYRQSRMRNVPHEDENGETFTTREKIWVPSTYCRQCTNAMKAGQAKTRRWLAQQDEETREMVRAGMQGDCGVCGARSSKRVMTKRPKIVPACPACRNILERCEYAVERVRDGWFALYRHIADEERIAREIMERTDRTTVPAHRFNPDAKDAYWSHAVCVSMETNWRAAMRWLQRETPEE